VFSNGYADVTPEDVFVHFSNPTFDGSTFEVWGALLNGARVVIVPQDTVLDPVRFGRLLLDEGVTVLNAMGYPLERFGLGVSLFSNEKNLKEKTQNKTDDVLKSWKKYYFQFWE